MNVFIALDDDEGEIYNTLKAHGATVSKSVVKATKVYPHPTQCNFFLSYSNLIQVLITSQKTASDSNSPYAGDIAKAQNLGIPIVKLECLIAAINDEGFFYLIQSYVFLFLIF